MTAKQNSEDLYTSAQPYLYFLIVYPLVKSQCLEFTDSRSTVFYKGRVPAIVIFYCFRQQ